MAHLAPDKEEGILISILGCELSDLLFPIQDALHST
jgi:hypothetical protein